MVKKIEKQLTLEVLKDVYLFVSQLEVINSNISLLLEKGVFNWKDLSIGNFGKYIVTLFFMLHSFVYYISRECDQDFSVSIKTTQQMHHQKTEA